MMQQQQCWWAIPGKLLVSFPCENYTLLRASCPPGFPATRGSVQWPPHCSRQAQANLSLSPRHPPSCILAQKGQSSLPSKPRVIISSLFWTLEKCTRVESGIFFLLVEGRWEEVGHTHTHSHVCTVAWTHLFKLKHHLHGHTQVHTHPNAQVHTLKCMNTPTHICKQTGHIYAHLHTFTGLGRYSRMLVLTHMCTQTHAPHLENCTLTRWGHCPHPPGAGASQPSPRGLRAQRGFFTVL